MGSGGWHLRSRLWATRDHASTGRGLSAVAVHFMLHLHGGLPTIQRTHWIRGRGDNFPGTALQYASDRGGAETRAVGSAHGGRRDPGMRIRAELRGSLPKRDSADAIYFRGRRGGDEAGAG